MGWPTLTGDDRAAALDLVRRALAARTATRRCWRNAALR